MSREPMDRDRDGRAVKTTPLLNNRYHIFNLDLSVARNIKPIGMRGFLKSRNVEFANHMVILGVPSPWFFRVNRGNAPVCAAIVGDEWEDFEIHEMFITNPIGLGFAQIYIEWRAP